MPAGTRLTRDEWQSVGIGAGAVVGAAVVSRVGLSDGWSALAVFVGSVLCVLIAGVLARYQPHPPVRPTLGVAMVVGVAAVALAFVVGRLVGVDPYGYINLAWFMVWFAGARIVAGRLTARLHPDTVRVPIGPPTGGSTT